MDLSELRTDKEKVEGVWLKYGEDAEFFIASTESKTYTKALGKLTKKYQPHKVRNDPATQLKIAKEAMAEALLLDFRGITDGGKPLKNTIENRRTILEVDAVRSWIADQAQDIANFQTEGESADAADLKSDS
jgi:hypothetical protein